MIGLKSKKEDREGLSLDLTHLENNPNFKPEETVESTEESEETQENLETVEESAESTEEVLDTNEEVEESTETDIFTKQSKFNSSSRLKPIRAICAAISNLPFSQALMIG